MKKLIYWVVGLAAVLSAGSCQKEINYLAGDTAVCFEVSAGDVVTKAIADGTNVNVLYWELYGADPANARGPLGEGIVREKNANGDFEVNLTLIADQTYNIIFWAQVDGKDHYVVDDLRNVAINTYADELANDESRAAFYKVYSFATENGVAISGTVELTRPFAQLNLGATTYKTSLNQVNNGQIVVNSTAVKITGIANSFNTLEGEGETTGGFDKVAVFAAAATPNGNRDKTEQLLTVNSKDYYWLGMNYLIVDSNVTVEMTLNTNMGVVNHRIDDVPVEKNFRTNILGDMLTTGAQFVVEVDPDFLEDDQFAGNEFDIN